MTQDISFGLMSTAYLNGQTKKLIPSFKLPFAFLDALLQSLLLNQLVKITLRYMELSQIRIYRSKKVDLVLHNLVISVMTPLLT